MHFRKCVALVVREYVAQDAMLPVHQIAAEDIIKFCVANKHSEFIQCIYYALFGVEASTSKAKQLYFTG
jgi:hypothetical protein